MKKLKQLLTFLLVICTLATSAQEKRSSFSYDFGTDLMSKYVWRGTQYGGSYPSIQPYAELGIGSVSIGVWGAYTIGGIDPYQEFDLFVSASFAEEMFTLTFTDYYFPGSSPHNYYHFKKDETGHVLEGSLSFNGTKMIPLSVMLAVNFYGADAERINDDASSPDFNIKSGIQYSNYLELGYIFKIKEMEMNAFAGMTFSQPRKPDAATGYAGETGLYGTGPGVVNLGLKGSKSIAITDAYSLPLSCAVITNPQTESVFLVFGISF